MVRTGLSALAPIWVSPTRPAPAIPRLFSSRPCRCSRAPASGCLGAIGWFGNCVRSSGRRRAAVRPLGGCDLSIARWVGSSGDGFGRLLLAQTVALELQAMGVVDDPVEDGVGEGRLADQVVPAVDRDLAGDQGGAAAVAFFD